MSKSRVFKLISAVAAMLLMAAATPANALTFTWSFVTTGDSDNPGQTVSGLIWGLHEGPNFGSGVHASVTSTPTGDLEAGIWDFYETTPPLGIAFVVSGGVLSYANAGFTLGGASPFDAPQLMFSINNDANDYSFPWLTDSEEISWYAGFDGTTTFTPKAYLKLGLEVPYMLLASAIDPNSPNYDPAQISVYQDYLRAARANSASMAFAAAPEVPLPAALPLFAAGISAMGFMGWRRRRMALTN